MGIILTLSGIGISESQSGVTVSQLICPFSAFAVWDKYTVGVLNSFFSSVCKNMAKGGKINRTKQNTGLF
jgi:hypothetical protein